MGVARLQPAPVETGEKIPDCRKGVGCGWEGRSREGEKVGKREPARIRQVFYGGLRSTSLGKTPDVKRPKAVKVDFKECHILCRHHFKISLASFFFLFLKADNNEIYFLEKTFLSNILLYTKWIIKSVGFPSQRYLFEICDAFYDFVFHLFFYRKKMPYIS